MKFSLYFYVTCSCWFSLISLRENSSLLSVPEIFTAHSLILLWTPIVTNGSFLHNRTSKACPTRKQYEMRYLLYVVCCTKFICHSEILKCMSEQCLMQNKFDNLLNLSDITEGTNFIFLKRKQEVFYIDFSGVIQTTSTV